MYAWYNKEQGVEDFSRLAPGMTECCLHHSEMLDSCFDDDQTCQVKNVVVRQLKRKAYVPTICAFVFLFVVVAQIRNYWYILPPLSQLTMTTSIDGITEGAANDAKLPAGHPLLPSANTYRERAVFYNIYIPKERKKNAFGIVKEQLAWKQSSRLLQNATLYYVLIGLNATKRVSEICRSYASSEYCQLLEYISQGDEAITLQHLYKYCMDHPLSQVSYIHNKGSFHPSQDNHNFRNFLNHGVFGSNGEHCQAMPLEHCNICGARFSSIPHYHFPGNMWTASCDFIRQLIPPMDFGEKMDALFKSRTDGVPRPSNKQLYRKWPVGLSRYTSEHWVGSHPHIRPCDIYSEENYTFGHHALPDLNTKWIAKLMTGPRFSMRTFRENFLTPNPTYTETITGEWFCGQARLWEYASLYNGLQPDRDHFVWNYYRENFTGCQVPLDFELHHDMFGSKELSGGPIAFKPSSK